MRILGFSEHYPKLEQGKFSTFRFIRRDKRDWQVGEIVQVMIKPRGGGEKLGIAKIINKEPRWMTPKLRADIPNITEEEAKVDGFEDWRAMWKWLLQTYNIRRLVLEPMNKLTLVWVNKGEAR